MASNVTVKIKRQENNVSILIEDNGQGFDTENSKRGGLGLVGLKERTQLLNGEFSIDSKLKIGTQITVRIPI